MLSVIPPGDRDAITVIGKSQGYLGLAVHFGTVVDETTGRETPALTTAFQPTPAELAALNAGASVVIRLINVVQHPPIAVWVGETPVDMPEAER
jgi:hypothetical protein